MQLIYNSDVFFINHALDLLRKHKSQRGWLAWMASVYHAELTRCRPKFKTEVPHEAVFRQVKF